VAEVSGWQKWILISIAGAALYDLVLRRYFAQLLSGGVVDPYARARQADQVQ
jgi:hypothetical protein